jgi:hypothetical protein
MDPDTLAAGEWAGLRAWAAKDSRANAAVQLLIEHDHWLWNDEFTSRCIYTGGGLPAVNFDAVYQYWTTTPAASESQSAMLRVIADIGSGRWGLDVMDARNRNRVIDAVTRAAGMNPQ